MSMPAPQSGHRAGAARRETAVVLAGGFDQIDLIDELKRRGWRVALIDYHAAPPAARHADVHHQASTLDLAAVEAIVRAEDATLLTTACTDQALLSVAQVSERLGLPCPFGNDAALQLTNKRWMKEKMQAWGIPTSPFLILRDTVAPLPAELPFPIVCKPVDANSSKGVTLAATPADFPSAFAQARAASRSGEVVCEPYLAGAELSIDAFVIGGKAHVLMVSESHKLANSRGAFPIHRSIQPAPAAHALAGRIETVVSRIAEAFGIHDSPMIVQAIASDQGLHILELSARIAGGAKHRFIRAATGYDVMGAYVDTLFGLPPATPPARSASAPDALFAMQYLYTHPGVFAALAGFDELKSQGVIVDCFPTKTFGMEIGEALNSSNRVAAVLLTAADPADLERKFQRLFAHARVLDPQGRDLLLRPSASLR